MARLGNFLVVLATTVACLLGMELVVRVLDGYQFATLRLKLSAAPQTILTTKDEDGISNNSRRHVAALPVADGVDRAWFELDPPAYPVHAYPEFLKQIAQSRGGAEDGATYIWNVNWLKKEGCVADGLRQHFAQLPDKILTFSAPNGDLYPTYRLPTFGNGHYSINRFGFRGPDIAFDKPNETVRIAFTGSSTVIEAPEHKFAYPELVINWLNVWSAHNGHKVKFEVINGGRSGVSPLSIEKIITQEILPLGPDLVMFDTTAHGLFPSDIVKLEGNRKSQEEVRAELTARRQAALAHGRAITEWSALARRIYLATHTDAASDPEVPTPQQSIVWPAGVSEQQPDPDQTNLPMDLSVTIAALDRIHRATSDAGGEFAVISAMWQVDPALKLDVIRNWDLFRYLNETYYPLNLSSLSRALRFQNKVFEAFSRRRNVPYFDDESEMPIDADLFGDATHPTPDGSRVKAWILFNQLLPFVAAKIGSGAWPHDAAPATVDQATTFPEPTLANNPCLQSEEKDAAFVRTGTPVFSLATDGSTANYKGGVSETRIAPEADGLLVTSSEANFYQLVSDLIPVDPHKDYVITYDYKLLQGRMKIGILSEQDNRFLVVRDLDQGQEGIAHFRPPSNTVRIVVTNNTPGLAISRVKIHKAEVYAAVPASNQAER
ncbi:MAG TPA: hypothetical protein VHW69_15260 [Rhizomicrobium sp.]|jgi:hypothetical protein|nr:hypothetical protein [Rhizomicrobium sp.]